MVISHRDTVFRGQITLSQLPLRTVSSTDEITGLLTDDRGLIMLNA